MKLVTKILITVTTIVYLFYSYIPFYYPLRTNAVKFDTHRVAHAGGEIDGFTYTNSFEALNKNLESGFVYFELDLLLTSDDSVICLHDWKSFLKKNNLNKVPNLKEFKKAVEKKKYKNCTLEELVNWMNKNKNKNIKIITDSKKENLLILKIIRDKVPNYSTRIIPQIYYPEEFNKVKDLGFKSVIWTLYRYKLNNNMVLYKLRDFHGEIAITMPLSRAKNGLSRKIKELGLPTYVHTINDEILLEKLQNNYDVTNIYTDNLPP